MVRLCMRVGTPGPGNSSRVVATLPEGFRPPANVYGAAVAVTDSEAAIYPASYLIRPNGAVSVATASASVESYVNAAFSLG